MTSYKAQPRRFAAPQVSWSTLTLALVCLVSGCAVTQDPLAGGREAFYAGDLEAAQRLFREKADADRRWAEVARLDLAIAELAAGNHQTAEGLLREARDHFDAQPKRSPVAETKSLFSDDTGRVFRAAGYEQVMLRAMLAMTSLAGDGTDAESYALQAQMRQEELALAAEERGLATPANFYQPIALAPYLRGVLREATHHDYDDATRAYRLVSQWQPDFAPVGSDIERASTGTHSQPGHGVLYVFACVGRGPVLVETVAETTTQALQIASIVVDAASNQAPMPRIANVPIAQVVVPQTPAVRLGVTVNGQAANRTETLTNVAALASAQAEAERPWTIARAVARRVTKEATVKAAANTFDLDGMTAGIFSTVVVSTWASSEKADLRCWGLLPREIQVTRVELPAGRHSVGLEVLGAASRPIGPLVSDAITIRDGQTHFVMAFAPDQRVVARVGFDQP